MNPGLDLTAVAALADEFAAEGAARRRRTTLDPEDFARLAATGFHAAGAPIEFGGAWRSVAASSRPLLDALRLIARGDASVALVASMHVAVQRFWLVLDEHPAEAPAGWAEQRALVYGSALGGEWWGTITSEPGSGGDVFRTRAVACRDADGWRLSGRKHFGSGSGVIAYAVTTAIPEDEQEPDWFFLDERGVPWDGSRGMTLVSEWDGHGMRATQSHAFNFEHFPATRIAWPGQLRLTSKLASASLLCTFGAVIAGVLDAALAAARTEFRRRRDTLRPFELTEWARAETELWAALQCYEAMVRDLERNPWCARGPLRGKIAMAELAEAALGRLCRAMGGGVYHRAASFGCWLEDVRALGFLRPPWGVAFDQLLQQMAME